MTMPLGSKEEKSPVEVHGRERPQLPRGALDLAAGFPIHEEEQRVLANRAARFAPN
jgi:hypothetical protein